MEKNKTTIWKLWCTCY